jgi:hypothetical protein
VFSTKNFLWSFVVAWSKSGKTGDEKFVEDQQKVMNIFDMKKGLAGSALAGALAVCTLATHRSAAQQGPSGDGNNGQAGCLRVSD